MKPRSGKGNELPARDSLEIEVKDFGPIVEAKVDLRPLTVFVGPSNTGKSYLAILIYALHRYFSDSLWPRRRMFQRDRDEKLPKETIKSIVELAEQILEYKGKPLPEEGIVLPAPVTDAIRSRLSEQDDYLGNEIGRCFGIEDAGALIRKGTTDTARIAFRRHNAKEAKPIDHSLTISANAKELETVIPEGTRIRIGLGDDDYPIGYLRRMAMEMISLGDRGNKRSNSYAWMLLEELTDQVPPQIVGPLALPAFYLPADRTGIMHAHSVVVSALIGSAAMTGLRPAARTPMLSGVLADFLEQLIEPDRAPRRGRKPRQDIATPIEKAILGGSVSIVRSEGTGYPHFTYRPKGWKDDLPLMHASSMVSELAPVVLYLRHMVVPGNMLIVEEPESHLHPAMQVEFTRQLAMLVDAGVRVIVTTHSEWVLEELANIVSRSGLAETEREGAGGNGIALRPAQVGVWLFKPKGRPKGSVVEESRLDDSGLFPSGFDGVAAALHNDWADLASRIGEAG